jgi:hypothetical protein
VTWLRQVQPGKVTTVAGREDPVSLVLLAQHSRLDPRLSVASSASASVRITRALVLTVEP